MNSPTPESKNEIQPQAGADLLRAAPSRDSSEKVGSAAPAGADTWGTDKLDQGDVTARGAGRFKTTRNHHSIWSKISLVLIGLLIGCGGLWWVQQQKQRTQDQRRERQNLQRQAVSSEIERLWSRYHLRLENTRLHLQGLVTKSSQDLPPPELEECARFFEEVSQAMAGKADSLRPAKSSLPAEIHEMHGLVQEWLQARNRLNARFSATTDREDWERLLADRDRERRCWQELLPFFTAVPQAQPDYAQIFSARLETQLRQKQALTAYGESARLYDQLGVSEALRPAWLGHWKALSESANTGVRPPQVEPDELISSGAPGWLVAGLIARQLEAKKSVMPSAAENNTASKPIPTSKPREQSPTRVITSPTYPIYVASVRDFSDGELAKLPSLPMQEQMSLQILSMGMATQAPLKLEKTISGATGGLMYFAKNKVAAKKESFVFESGKLIQIPDALANNHVEIQPQQGLRLQATDREGKPLFELYLQTPKTPSLEFLLQTTAPQAELKDQAYQEFSVRLGYWLQRIHSGNGAALAYRLTKDATANSKQAHYDLSPIDGGKEWWKMNSPVPPEIAKAEPRSDIAQLKIIVTEAQKNVRTAVNNQMDRIVSNMGMKLNAAHKEAIQKADQERVDQAKDRLTKAQNYLAAAQSSNSFSPQPPSVKPETGRYRLSVRGITGSESVGFVDLCIVELN
jgi:hypothetical protein